MLRLQFNDNQSQHQDLILLFAGQEWICDSYYLAIDDALLPDRRDAHKILTVLRRLLEQWLSAIEVLKPGNTAYCLTILQTNIQVGSCAGASAAMFRFDVEQRESKVGGFDRRHFTI